MFERRLYFHVDWLLLGAILLLCAIGVATIYSTTYITTAGRRPCRPPRSRPSSTRSASGCSRCVICLAIDYRMLAEHSLFIYGALIVLLIFVLVKGQTQMGGQRWIPIGPFHLQPSEFGRIGVALLLAMYFGENRRGAKNTGDLMLGGIFTAIPLLLIAKQPDLGTAVTLIPVFVGVAFLAGLRLRLLGVLALAAVLARAPRVEVRAQGLPALPHRDLPRPGAGPAGRGLPDHPGPGRRRLRRPHRQGIPAGHAGAVQVPARRLQRLHLLGPRGRAGVHRRAHRRWALYLFVILRSLEAARLAKDRLGAYLVGGIISGFAFQVIYNVTMSAGLAPVKGITLPLMSYGGSSLIASLAGFGLILNVRMRRFTN